jgi:ubiquinol-cytochrome c reductase cytochrome c subunit
MALNTDMSIRWLLAVALAGTISAALNAGGGQAQSLPQGQTTPAGNSENGRKLFVSYGCYQCHGYEAQGSSATGPRLGPRPIGFAQLSKYVRAPTGQMPPYTTKVLADGDLTDIYAFLQSRPQPAAVDSIPLLK